MRIKKETEIKKDEDDVLPLHLIDFNDKIYENFA